MSDPLQRVLRAHQPLTLAGVPTGFLPWLAADLARAAHGSSKSGRAVAIVADEAAMRALADTAPLFAPEVEVLTLPAWDCLPYDRASPALRVTAERLATLSALQAKPDGPQLLVTTRRGDHAAPADPVPGAPADPPHRRGRADRPRGPDRRS